MPDKKVKVLDQVIKNNYALYHGDAIDILKNVPDNSIHYAIFSPPFASLFTFSDNIRDISNTKEYKDFSKHFNFIIPELYRILMPGRLLSFHCMNLPTTYQHHGYIGLIDFRGKLIRQFEKHKFIYHSEVCIWKDPLVQAVRTKNITLVHKQMVKDSAMCGIGLPDYLVTMRKIGSNPEKIEHKNGFTYYIGEHRPPLKSKIDLNDQKKNKYSQEIWYRYASPVWFDINQTNTLNVKQARDKRDERHIAPLQLDVIARCLHLWTNKNDIVLSPFMGIGSEGYQAIRMKRKFVGIELKDTYYKEAIRNLKSAIVKSKKGRMQSFIRR